MMIFIVFVSIIFFKVCKSKDFENDKVFLYCVYNVFGFFFKVVNYVYVYYYVK